MNTQQRTDRARVLREVQALVREGNCIILDTETTGVGPQDQIVSWAIIGPDGNTLGQGLVKATIPFSESALSTHHIREEQLAEAPGFGEAWAMVEPLLRGKTVVAYGVDFDLRLLRQSAAACHLELSGLDEARSYCLLRAYAAFRGEPDEKHADRAYRWHKLTAACAAEGIVLEDAHDAVADARATVHLLQALARVADEEDRL